MKARKVTNEEFNNLQKVLDGEKPEVVAHLDVVTANAVKEHAAAEEHIEEVAEELKTAADVLKVDQPEEQDAQVKNEFTAKLTLDESLENFQLQEEEKPVAGRARKVYDDDDEDEYLDFDMFDFIYGLVTDCWPKPLNPLDHKLRKFMYIGSDTYTSADRVEAGNVLDGHAQVASTGDKIQVYANKPEEFNDIIEICNLYKFEYTGPAQRRSKSTYWEYSLDIHVPCVSSGYPYMVEEYFETIGKTIEDVMPEDFCKQYRKRQARVEKEAQKYINDAEVDKIVKQAVTAAAQDNTEPLNVHLKRLYTALDDAGLTYQKSKVKKTFMDEFADDFDDDED